ncbi:Uncharacterized protein dnm_090350 [Desulfonema magnum]|uniref:Uncharacterized protein n=1 Tax=Desulfonema magnum TaxID=45655 RepID=A0A975BWS4_9BACT|nr:Uncharacterized protein dnm_090350 [Desulfonema magnum]
MIQGNRALFFFINQYPFRKGRATHLLIKAINIRGKRYSFHYL